MRIISIDPGFDKIGVAIFETKPQQYIHSQLIQTIKAETLSLRIRLLYTELEKVIEKYKPEEMVMEKLFFFKNHKTMIQVAQAQGAMMALAASRQLEVFFLTPLEIKQIVTGYGTADKKSVQKMLKISLQIDSKGKEDDETDAIACGYAWVLRRVSEFRFAK